MTDYGKPIFAADVRIPARLEYKRRAIMNAKGEEVISEHLVITSAKIAVGDVIVIDGRDCPVISINPQYGLGGRVMHYEART